MSWRKEGWDDLMVSLEENECLLADGFDTALVGITEGVNPVAVYDVNRMLNHLTEQDGMTYEEAREHLDYNVIGAYVGEKTPVYIDLDFEKACALPEHKQP
tara:strand:- start:285 stop:587 length:303 start_codon:yes stop_codon:yes gene_type:complete